MIQSFTSFAIIMSFSSGRLFNADEYPRGETVALNRPLAVDLKARSVCF